MIPYTIHRTGDSRILEVLRAVSDRFRFYEVAEDGTRTKVVPRGEGTRLYAIVGERLMVYKKPKVNDFHFELTRENSRGLRDGVYIDTDRLLENMMEYVEII